jgi:UrcA family protein
LWIACSVAAAPQSMAAVAAPAESPSQFVVRYADLDLSKVQDSAKLYERLERAAAHVCRGFDGPRLDLQRMKRQCEDAALTNAVAAVNHAAITALHQAASRTRLATRPAQVISRT